MKRKKIFKFIASLIKKPLFMLGVYVCGIIFVFLLSSIIVSDKNVLDTIMEIVASQDTLTLFFAGLFSLTVAEIVTLFHKYMEESLKTEDNHHKIISHYNAHKLGETSYKENVNEKKGVYLSLTHVKVPKNSEKEKQKLSRHTQIKDKQSKAYRKHMERVDEYLKKKLCLCSLNVFANVLADTEIKFEDTNKNHELSPFIISHADEILQAHKNSITKNSDTIRLADFDYEEKTLKLITERSTYYHMLVTNRCMDYRFANGMSIRDTYEYGSQISPLKDSGLGNQIGINGLVITNNDYILIEKRGQKKTTWKNKFGQSISFALKEKDLLLQEDGTIKGDTNTAEANLKKVIEKSLADNFGLTTEDYDTFIIKENFLGLARDLLEGGKPNLYFYVRVKYDAETLKNKLEANASLTYESIENEKKAQAGKEEAPIVIETSKLDSDYYLVPFSEIAIDFNYRMFLNRKNAYKVCRKLPSRHKKIVVWWDKFKTKTALLFKPVLVRECGEALLVTLAYLELRWKWYQEKNKPKEDKKDEQ